MSIDIKYGKISEADKNLVEIRENDTERWLEMLRYSGVAFDGLQKWRPRYNLLQSAIIATHPGVPFHMTTTQIFPDIYEIIYLGEKINAQVVVDRMLSENPFLKSTERDEDDYVHTIKNVRLGGGGFRGH